MPANRETMLREVQALLLDLGLHANVLAAIEANILNQTPPPPPPPPSPQPLPESTSRAANTTITLANAYATILRQQAELRRLNAALVKRKRQLTKQRAPTKRDEWQPISTAPYGRMLFRTWVFGHTKMCEGIAHRVRVNDRDEWSAAIYVPGNDMVSARISGLALGKRATPYPDSEWKPWP